MADDSSFLDAIQADLDADAPRLAHADWLEANGDPERAEYIRLALRPTRTAAEFNRLNALRREHGRRWDTFRPDAAGMTWHWERGYPEELSYTSFSAFSATWKRALVPPLRWVTFSDLRNVSRLAESPGLERIRWLRLAQHGLDDETLRLLLESPHLGQLLALGIRNGRLSGASLRLVGSSPRLAGLRRLELASGCGGPVAPEDVAALARLHALRTLWLQAWKIAGENACTLWAARWPDLAYLSLANNALDAAGLVGLGDGAFAPALAGLYLMDNRLGDDGAEALARAVRWTGLRTLELQDNLIGDRGAEALAAAPHLAGLRKLNLRSNGVGDAGAEALARLGGLESLTLVSNSVGDAGMMALGRSTGLPSLRRLEATANPARPEVIKLVIDRFREGRPPLDELPPMPLPAVPVAAPGEAVGEADEDGLVREILADPRDAVARAVYADWLEENGSPLHARLLRLPLADPGRRALVAQIGKPIVAAFPDFNVAVSEDEGLIVVHMQLRGYLTKAFERDGPAWLRTNRIARLSLIGESKDWAKTGNLPIAAHLRGLGMRGCNLRDQGAAQLAQATGLGRLCSLDLRGTKLSSRGAQALGRSPHFPRLACLQLGGTRPGAEGVRAVANGPLSTSLRRLELEGTRIGDLSVAVLAASPALAGLATLNLSGNWLTDQAMQSLAASPHTGLLRNLDMGRNRFTDTGLMLLARSPLAGRLRWLGLASVSHGTLEGWRALAAALHPDCRVGVYRSASEGYLAPMRELLGTRIVPEVQ